MVKFWKPLHPESLYKTESAFISNVYYSPSKYVKYMFDIPKILKNLYKSLNIPWIFLKFEIRLHFRMANKILPKCFQIPYRLFYHANSKLDSWWLFFMKYGSKSVTSVWNVLKLKCKTVTFHMLTLTISGRMCGYLGKRTAFRRGSVRGGTGGDRPHQLEKLVGMSPPTVNKLILMHHYLIVSKCQ